MRRSTSIATAALVTCLVTGCRVPTENESACTSLFDAQEKVGASMEELERLAAAVPKDVVTYPEQSATALTAFSDKYEAINVEIEAMQDEFEAGCKWPYLEQGDFDAVFEQVYYPHIALLARQHRAVLRVGQTMEHAGPPEVVGQVVAGYHAVATQLDRGLHAQVAVCESDFGSEACDAFRDAVATELAKRPPPPETSPSEDGEPTNEESGAEAPQKE